ncbi:MAG: hypothetical protein H0W14_03220 [Actinobacteria bacterium]|nr:hypothetical protein [Actinomycetota bacterium]
MLAGGCGGKSGNAQPAVTPAEAIQRAAVRLSEEGTFRFDASFTRVQDAEPDEVEEYATAEGVVDLTAGKARASFELAPLFPGRENPAPLDDPVELRWGDESITVVADGRSQRLDRSQARESGGLLGRYPDEVDALDDLLADALRPRLLGNDDGEAHYSFTIDSRAAGRRGFPAELSDAFAQSKGGPKLELETWIGSDGLPHRLDYVIRLEPVRNDGKLILPARTVRVTYVLSEFGEPVDEND